MKKEQDELVDHTERGEDKTNWSSWYITLILVLVVQIVVYYLITKSF